jgi:hypothetical protein
MIVRWFEKHSDAFGSEKFQVYMAAAALVRVFVWGALIIAYILRVDRVVAWFDSVAFVSVLSALALLLTDWAQFAASAVGLSVVFRAKMFATEISSDIDRLVEMAEAEEAMHEAREVAERLKAKITT